jgi:4-amino-4-deoxy-L-arabinose transferase-like glycosyltransferase
MAPSSMAVKRDPPASITSTLREGGLALGVIVLIALVARLIQLNSGYWADEIGALQTSFRLPGFGVLTTFLGDTHHPLYSVFGRIALLLFGESPWAVRLPAVLFGVASVAATYVVARIVASRREALLASLFLAVSYHHVWFSQNARGYTLVALLALLSTWALVKMLEAPSWRLACAYAAFAALAAYTHATMVFVAIGQALAAAAAWAWPDRRDSRFNWRIATAAFALAAVFTVILYAPMLGQVVDFFVNRPSALIARSTPSWALREGIRVLAMGLGASGAVLVAIVVIAGGLVGLVGLASIFRASRALGLAIVLPPLTVLAGALLGRGTMYPRFFFFAAGTGVIVIVRGLFASAELLAHRWPRFPAAAVSMAACTVLILASTASLSLNYRLPKQDFAGAMRYVIDAKSPGDVVGFIGIPGDPYPTLYGQDWPTVRDADDLGALRTRGRTWLIYTFPRYLEVGAMDVLEIIRRDCRERAVFRGTVGGGDMIVCTLEGT